MTVVNKIARMKRYRAMGKDNLAEAIAQDPRVTVTEEKEKPKKSK